MEPMIYKPSIYKGAGIYKNGAEGGGDITSVEIGGYTYPVTKIDGKYWTAESLKFETSQFSYPNNDPNNKNDYGLLYKYKIVSNEILPLLKNGWRLPRKSDFEELFSNHTNPLDYIKTSLGGNDSLGFGAELAGNRNYDGNFTNFESRSYFWTINYGEVTTSSPYYVRFYDAKIEKLGAVVTDLTAADVAVGNLYSSLSIRLIHD